MPELPEVETVILGLHGLLRSHTIRKVDYDWPNSFRISNKDVKKFILNSNIIDVRRRGKMILIDLSTQKTLLIHLKLTGQLVYKQTLNLNEIRRFGAGHPTKSLISKLPDKTTRVIFELDRQAHLFFNDLRKFGWIQIFSTKDIEQTKYISSLGPDALKISNKEFVQAICTRHKSIKACLLDQTIIAGCGNIYADESLWLSKIHPNTLASKLKPKQGAILCKQLQNVLKLGLHHGGSSIRNYVNAKGEKGGFLDFVNVYQRKGLPCKRCQNKINRIIVASRGTHICEVCQK